MECFPIQENLLYIEMLSIREGKKPCLFSHMLAFYMQVVFFLTWKRTNSHLNHHLLTLIQHTFTTYVNHRIEMAQKSSFICTALINQIEDPIFSCLKKQHQEQCKEASDLSWYSLATHGYYNEQKVDQ